MVDLQAYLERRLKEAMSAWEEEGVYAISFLVCPNEAYKYRGCSNVTAFSISCNTERDCGGADRLSERRWNYAFWRREETPILTAAEDDEGMGILFAWYEERGIGPIGLEDSAACYDAKMRYIGRGPTGCWELLWEIAAVARKLQESGWIRDKFGAPIPITLHDLEYSWYMIEATRAANPHGEADEFLTAMKALGILGSV